MPRIARHLALPKKLVENMSRNELMAVALDRGYVNPGSPRPTPAMFLEMQAADELITDTYVAPKPEPKPLSAKAQAFRDAKATIAGEPKNTFAENPEE